MNFGSQTAYTGTEFLPVLRKFSILLYCQDSHMEVSKRNSTKLCDTVESESHLQMHVNNLRCSPPKNSGAKN